MLEILGRTLRQGHGLNRRSFLKIGSLGFAGLTLPQVLGLRQTQASSARRDTAVILFWMAGGPSHIDTYDMKPMGPELVAGPFRPMRTNLVGLQVCELLPRHSGIADKLTVIRSLQHDHNVHDDASHWVQTGYPLLNARQRGQQQPAQGAVVSHLHGPRQAGLPAYVCIPEAYNSRQGFYQQAAFLGARHNPVNAGGDPRLGNYRLPEFSLPGDLSLSRLQDRRQLALHVDGLRRRVESSGQLAAMEQAQRQAFELVTGERARAAFDLGREPMPLHDKYGRHAWGQAALLARRLVEAGVTFVTINLYEKDIDWWDDHTALEANLRRRLPLYDQALTTLIQDLAERGLSDRVLVAAFGEFGRSPRVDSQGGRGHWPKAMSAVLSGGGIKTGQVIGATTPNGAEPRDRPLGPGDLLASMYRVLGIDPEQILPDRQNRPMRLVDVGQPIAELF